MSEPIEPNCWERGASMLGRSPAEVAAWDRIIKGLQEMVVGRLRLELAAHDCTAALERFADAWAEVNERQTVNEAREVASHPDLAELNVRLDAFYP